MAFRPRTRRYVYIPATQIHFIMQKRACDTHSFESSLKQRFQSYLLIPLTEFSVSLEAYPGGCWSYHRYLCARLWIDDVTEWSVTDQPAAFFGESKLCEISAYLGGLPTDSVCRFATFVVTRSPAGVRRPLVADLQQRQIGKFSQYNDKRYGSNDVLVLDNNTCWNGYLLYVLVIPLSRSTTAAVRLCVGSKTIQEEVRIHCVDKH